MIEDITTGGTASVEVGRPIAFYQHGWHSWCETRWVDPSVPRRIIDDERDRLGHDDPLHASDSTPGGAGVGAVDYGDGTVTLLGALRGGAWVRHHRDTLVGEYEDGSGPWVTLSGPEQDVFARYAALLGDELGRRGGKRMRLWCSWYSAYEDVTEELMHETLEGLGDLPFDVVQLDDGWEQAIGDWEPNNKFPSGLGDLAARIQDTGRQAGLWLAPFIARTNSRLAAERPELFLRDDNGDPVVAGVNWGGPYWALDVTSDEALTFVEDTMGRYRQLGFTFFKLDFIYAGAVPGHHRNPTSRAAAYRAACERIREAVGEDAYLLACGAPIIESIGLFDGIRIGPDVGPVWADGSYAAIQPALLTSTHRLWLRPAIDPDPDVVYFRPTELTERTMTRLRQLAQITGFLGTSDLPQRLSPGERETLRKFLTARPEIQQVGRHRWVIDGKSVDLSPVLTAGAVEPEWDVAS